MTMHVESPQDRRSEIAEILARGYLRLTAKRAKETPQATTRGDAGEGRKLSESSPIPLDRSERSGPYGRVVNTKGAKP